MRSSKSSFLKTEHRKEIRFGSLDDVVRVDGIAGRALFLSGRRDGDVFQDVFTVEPEFDVAGKTFTLRPGFAVTFKYLKPHRVDFTAVADVEALHVHITVESQNQTTPTGSAD